MASEQYRHIIIDLPPKIRAYTTTDVGGGEIRIPTRDRQSHSDFLKNRLEQAWKDAEDERKAVSHVTRQGVYLEFKSDPNADLVIKSLEDLHSKKVRLLNVRTEKTLRLDKETKHLVDDITTYATVYVARDKKSHFLNKITKYAEEETEKGNPINADLINSIMDIKKALRVDSFWQDDRRLIPTDQPEWCEVWLSSDLRGVIDRFETLIKQMGLKAKEGVIRFPERAVKVIHANRQQLEQLTSLSDDIAEYRRAKETAAFWLEMPSREQAEWVKDLLRRSRVGQECNVAVCILDTGVNNGHPLLKSLLKDEDCQTVNEAWGDYDHNGHGTLMAGSVGYGDLMTQLSGRDLIHLGHCLESVKILPKPPDENTPDLWGHITSRGISLAEINSPNKKRIICMAVTAPAKWDKGRPTSWSGEIDQITSGALDDIKRLFIISAGNTEGQKNWLNYKLAQKNETVQDPAQAWNALSVGAYTELDQITEPLLSGYKPIAPRGGLSPYTTTSSTWDDRWPIKPEIVMEGGNAAHDGYGFATECADLSLLSTYYKTTECFFKSFRMTSAATAQAAWFAARIQNRYPEFQPETIRALMVHSAEWTDMLKKQFLADESKKTSYAELLRICGYGVPNLERALSSASNSLTMISEQEIQPFAKRESGNGYRTKEMHLHELPWPKDALLDLPDGVQVNMRVTLSYFVEPGPGEIGWKDRYRYASYQLRFDVNSPGESFDDFIKRTNKAVREEDEKSPNTKSASKYWLIGSNARNKGSIHSDIWQGTAADLASSNLIAVYPVIGWWRERSHLGKWDKRARYSLVVSIYTPEEAVDIYTPVANQVGITIPITVET